MKIKKGLILRKIADTYVIVAVGDAARNFNGMITLNETGAFLWEGICAGDDEQALVQKLMQNYEIDEQTAKNDVAAFVKKVTDAGFTE